MRRLGFLLPVLFLAGCDDGSAARQNLAQCELSPHAKQPEGSWNDNYLSTCMQAKGWIVEKKHTALGVKCGDLDYPEIAASCYRPDNALAKWLAELNAR